MATGNRSKSMSTLDFDLDLRMNGLEREWRQAYEASISARADYQSMALDPRVNPTRLHKARVHLDRTEALKARVMAKIECLEDSVLGQD
jgi:hypothetical protein